MMLSLSKKIASSGGFLALTLIAVTACTEANPREQLAYCQQYSTWATEAPSAARNCAVPSIASRDAGYDLGSISQ
jgi:hypothetical protein